MLRRLLAAGLGVALISLGVGASVVLPVLPAGATTFPDFGVCPPVGSDTVGCQIVIVINPDGTPTIATNPDPSSGPFDNSEDSLIGIQNNSGQPISAIPLSGTGIFGFDGDGLCSFISCTAWPHPTGYEGPGTTFTTTADTSNGAVNFTAGLPDQGSAYFSLEGVATGSSLAVDALIQATPVTASTTVGFSGQVANFTDAGCCDFGYTATVDWGDGTALDNSASISGSAPNFTVSGAHTFASTGSKSVQVTITDSDNASNQAIVNSSFAVSAACVAGQTCTETASQPGVETEHVTTHGINVSVALGTDANFGCAGTLDADQLAATLTSSGGGTTPKTVTSTIDQSQVGATPASAFHICYGGGAGFTDINGRVVPPGGVGLLPFCVNLSGPGAKHNPPPCQVSSTLQNGNVVEVFYAPAGDPHYRTTTNPPTITSISPTSGSHLGGTLVTIKGTNFTLVQRVLFGTATGLSVRVVSSTSIAVLTPAHATGTVDIRVQTGAGASVVVTADKFTYS